MNGIGDAKAKALMKYFKTISAIKEADVEKLQLVSGISEKNAQEIYNFYHNL
ncbi:MAG: helix-hairpin-helix domain-containing protein [Clostridiales bacterium]